MSHRSDEIAGGPSDAAGASDRSCSSTQHFRSRRVVLTRETELVRRGESDGHSVWMSIRKEEVGNVRVEGRSERKA